MSVRPLSGTVKDAPASPPAKPMHILAIDTSLGQGSVAAADPAGTSERPLGPAGDHARVLTEAMAELAARRGWSTPTSPFGEFGYGHGDVVAVVRGPGSFTGLRVGVTTAKALAWTTGARLVGVSGFDVIARTTARLTGWQRPLAIAYDAGRGEVYSTIATPDLASPGGWSLAPSSLLVGSDWIASLPQGAAVSGPALTALGTLASARGDLQIAPTEAWLPSAAEVATMAAAYAIAGRCDDPATLVPEYLRPSYAEETRKPVP